MLIRFRATIICLSLCVFAHADSVDPDARLVDYQGSYQFPDGTIITGGRMDEGGRVMLLYLDTQNVSRAGIFDTSDGDFTGLYGSEASINFDREGDVMIWHESDGAIRRLDRIMKPETRPACFMNGDIRLAGTLYLPPGDHDALPAVVLAHGSGPVTRYQGPWVTFFVGEGYAVLAFDKRGTGESEGDWQRATYLDLSSDLVAAAEWLAVQAPIDATRIGLKTSSQSGWYGPHTVADSSLFAFLIQRAAPAVNIAVGTAHEIRQELVADEVTPVNIEAATDFWLRLHDMARRGASLERANAYLREKSNKAWFDVAFGDWASITPLWWYQQKTNMKLEPSSTVALLEEPVLWFLAENDENVPYRESLAALESAKDVKTDLSIVTVHDAGHSFLVSDGDGGVKYTDEYWSAMSRWLDEYVPDKSRASDR